MRIEVGVPDFRALVDGAIGNVAKAATGAMRATTPDAKQELRDQIVGAGLGSRLANTWRGDAYPKRGASLDPAGYIWSNAPDIVDSFARGAQIVPVNGSRYLAIPTDAVPRAPGAGRATSTKKMTPAQVEAAFNQDLFFKRGRDGRLLAFINAGRTAGGRASKRKAGSRTAKPVLMFVLVPTVRAPKLLDLNGPTARWADAFRSDLARRLA